MEQPIPEWKEGRYNKLLVQMNLFNLEKCVQLTNSSSAAQVLSGKMFLLVSLAKS